MILIAPVLNPIAVSLGPLAIHWYGLAYLASFLMILFWGKKTIHRLGLPATAMEDLVFFVGCGLLVGGRLGYMAFYQWPVLLAKPWVVFYLWQGGMSFHGGLLGCVAALYFFAHKNRLAFFKLSDFIVPMVPIGLGLGRLANWVNGELWGRRTHAAWGVVYPWVDAHARYPSQLIECFLEGIVLYCLLRYCARFLRHDGQLTAVFLMAYAVLRSLAECLRQPDSQLGYFYQWLTMGQMLCVPMFLMGWYLFSRYCVQGQARV
jgi:phosphatidylglycerol---prolipoprotein diacylglyceryl transferase